MADGVVEYDIRANTEYLEKDLNDSQGIAEKGGNALTAIAGKAAKAIGAAFAAVGIAEGIKGITGLVTDLEKSVNGFSASTGTAIADTEKYEQVMKNIYANNYGEDFQDIANSIALVNKNLGEMSDEELQTVTESAFALRDVFEYDVSETTRAAKAMMENFGVSGEDAMSLIAAGAQNGLDYSGELVDSINEYSVQFAKMGLTADDMFNIFQAGAENGAWNLDKIGDAVKEMSIRVIDSSKTTQEGFTAIGLNADEMAYKFAAGGDTARQAFQQTLQALSSMEDPIAQDAAGVALLGTMWEDLGKDAVASLVGVTGGVYDTKNAMEGIKEVKYNDLDSMLEGLKRNFELAALPIGEILIPQSKKMIETLVPLIQEYGPKIVDVIITVISYGIELKNAVLDKLTAVFGELKEPVIEFVKDIFPKLAYWFVGIGVRISELVSDVIPLLLDGLSSLGSMFSDIIKNVLSQWIKTWYKLWDMLSGFIQEVIPKLITAFEKIADPIMSLISEVFPILVNIVLRLYEVFFKVAETVIPALIDAFLTIAQAVLPIITDLLPKLLELAVNLIDPLLSLVELVLPALAECFSSVAEIIAEIIESVIPILIDLFNTLIPIIEDIISNVLPVLVEWFFAVADAVLGIIESVLPILIDLLNTLIPVILNIVSNVLPALTEVFTALKEPITELINSVLPLLQEILENVVKPAIDDMIPVIEILAGMFSDVLKNAIENVTPLISGITDILKNVIEFITDVFQGDWESAWTNIKETVLGIFNLIIAGIENGINSAVWLVNEMINGINGVTSEIGINAIPNIAEVQLPRFHTGGIIDFKGKYEAPILAKDGEMVLTEPQQKRLFEIADTAVNISNPVMTENNANLTSILSAVSQNRINEADIVNGFENALKNINSDGDTHLTVNIGQEKIEDIVITSIEKYNARTGGRY